MLFVSYNLKQTIQINKNLNNISINITKNRPQKNVIYLKMFFNIKLYCIFFKRTVK